MLVDVVITGMLTIIRQPIRETDPLNTNHAMKTGRQEIPLRI